MELTRDRERRIWFISFLYGQINIVGEATKNIYIWKRWSNTGSSRIYRIWICYFIVLEVFNSRPNVAEKSKTKIKTSIHKIPTFRQRDKLIPFEMFSQIVQMNEEKPFEERKIPKPMNTIKNGLTTHGFFCYSIFAVRKYAIPVRSFGINAADCGGDNIFAYFIHLETESEWFLPIKRFWCALPKCVELTIIILGARDDDDFIFFLFLDTYRHHVGLLSSITNIKWSLSSALNNDFCVEKKKTKTGSHPIK